MWLYEFLGIYLFPSIYFFINIIFKRGRILEQLTKKHVKTLIPILMSSIIYHWEASPRVRENYAFSNVMKRMIQEIIF